MMEVWVVVVEEEVQGRTRTVEEELTRIAEVEVVVHLVIPMPTPPASPLRVGMELLPQEGTTAVGRLKVVTVLLLVALVATEPKLVIRGGEEGGAGMGGRRGGGMEEMGGKGGREGV